MRWKIVTISLINHLEPFERAIFWGIKRKYSSDNDNKLNQMILMLVSYSQAMANGHAIGVGETACKLITIAHDFQW